MPPVRVKVYGLVSLTKKTYLRIQGLGLVLVLSLLAAGGVLMKTSGVWRPEFPPRSVPSAVILFFWISLATLLVEAIETPLVLRMFDRAERRQRDEEAVASFGSVLPSPATTENAIPLPSGVHPTRPLENHPHP